MQLHDNEQVDLTLSATDSKGYPVADTITATSADTSVATVVNGPDGKTFTVVAGAPGSTTITFSDGNLSATEAIDVVPGDVATISISEGTAVDQPAPAPVTPVTPDPTPVTPDPTPDAPVVAPDAPVTPDAPVVAPDAPVVAPDAPVAPVDPADAVNQAAADPTGTGTPA